MRRRLRTLAALAALAALPVAPARAEFLPDDPGPSGVRGGWEQAQWNFAGPYGVNALGAWRHLIARGRPGGAGVRVAVLDTGLAYRATASRPASPDLDARHVLAGHDFVDHDAEPTDANGHGTLIASLIAEQTNNDTGVTGLAYGARIMPVRVLNRYGDSRPDRLVDGIEWATEHGAQVINISIAYDAAVGAREEPRLLAAVRFAHDHGVVVVAAAGNDGFGVLALPAASRDAIAVGSTTEHGCLSDFSNTGPGLDLVAPGGGSDADGLADDPRCDPDDDTLRDLTQLTLVGPRHDAFGYPPDVEGTSMSAAEVSAAAALVIASGVIGPHPTPDAVAARLEATARDLGAPGRDDDYGAGLLDAEAATRPAARRSG